MKTGFIARCQSFGYTIIEVMIVLTVTSVLLVAAIAAISGQQQKTEFSQAIRDIESQVRDVINDVANGFYSTSSNFNCIAGGSGPVLSSIGSKKQGTNKDCIFIGRVIQFAVQGSAGEDFNIYTLVGQRQINDGAQFRDVKDLNEAKPTAIAPGSSAGSNFPDTTDAKTLSYGLNVQSMRYIDGSTSTNIGAVGFVSSLAKFEENQLKSGSQVVNLMPIIGSGLDQSPRTSVDAINSLDNNSPLNPDGGVSICFQSAGTNQNGVLTIGSNGRELTTDLKINEGACS